MRHTRELFPVHHFMPQNMKRRVNVIREAVAQQFQQPSVDKPMEGALRASVIDKLVNENSGKGQEVSTSQADSLYLPLFEYISSVMKEDLSRKGPLFVGISAPQGAGKTTLTTVLQHLFQMDHKLCAVLSLDDFYLTFQDQCKLATKHSSNPLLQYRGNAGSHDLPLLESTLHDLGDVSDVCYIPRFDKSLNHGRGDRAPQDEWSVLHETPDVVLLEGWMLGFAPVKLNLSTEMNDVNTYLHNYREIHRMMDTWLVIEAEKLEYVYKWRQEAETQMSNKGLPCMSESQESLVWVVCGVGIRADFVF